jgi:prepilin-type N-terminal cleavage/methylation domain-containing protein
MSETGRARDAGLTLIEVLAAVAVTTIVSLILFANLRPRFLVYAQRQTVSVVAERLRQAHAGALGADRPVAFAVAPNGRALGVSGMRPEVAPQGVALSSPNGRVIVFYGDGSSNGGVVWVTAANRSIPVWVVAATGAVAIGRKT